MLYLQRPRVGEEIMNSKKQVDPQEYLKRYLEMLEGSIMMGLTALKSIQKSKNLNAAKSIAHVAENGIKAYAKTFVKN